MSEDQQATMVADAPEPEENLNAVIVPYEEDGEPHGEFTITPEPDGVFLRPPEAWGELTIPTARKLARGLSAVADVAEHGTMATPRQAEPTVKREPVSTCFVAHADDGDPLEIRVDYREDRPIVLEGMMAIGRLNIGETRRYIATLQRSITEAEEWAGTFARPAADAVDASQATGVPHAAQG
ncbi:MAG: hypothetical protein GY842_28735 [bacterium]|nr:hypothetical protein [bacterium]